MPHADRFLVCGLGSLGQHTIRALHGFARGEVSVRITAVDLALPGCWEVADLPSLLAGAPVVGDCRKAEVLERAGVRECRAVLLLTTDETVNVTAALTVRRLAPRARIVLRSSRDQLNELLTSKVGGVVALEPAELPAAAFALAGRDDGTVGVFTADGARLRVVERTVGGEDGPLWGTPAGALHRASLRLVSLLPAGTPDRPGRLFFSWPEGSVLQTGDRVAWVEDPGPPRPEPRARTRPVSEALRALSEKGSRGAARAAWRWLRAERKRLVVLSGLVLAAVLWLTGTLLLRATVPDMTWQKAIASGVILMLGGFGDVFGGLEKDPVPWWVLLACLGITLTSVLFLLGVFGLIAEGIISSRLDLLAHRVRLPREGHVVVVGLGRVGRRVVAFLRNELGERVVGLTSDDAPTDAPPGTAVLVGDPLALLGQVRLAGARRLIAVTDDAMLNLEAALTASREAAAAGRSIPLTIRVFDSDLGESLPALLPDVHALNAYALSAQAFAGAAFGENVLGLFPLADRIVLVVEFAVERGDTLESLLLAEVAYGYGVVPVVHRRAGGASTILPGDEVRLTAGDALVVLSTLEGLRRIERAERTAPSLYRLSAGRPLSAAIGATAANALCAVSGVTLEEAGRFVASLPGALELRLYPPQAERLRSRLGRLLPGELAALPEP